MAGRCTNCGRRLRVLAREGDTVCRACREKLDNDEVLDFGQPDDAEEA